MAGHSRDGGPPIGPGLRATLGSPKVIRRLPSSPRSRVWLVEFDGSPAIVKQVTARRGASSRGAAGRYSREITALRLAGRVRPPVAAALLATEPTARMLVLEYLAGQGRGGDWLIDYASALARLHAATGPGDAGELPSWTGPGPEDARAFLELAAALRVPIAAQLPGELDALIGRLQPAGQFALLHGDPCPDNAVPGSDGIRFIDLEGAALGNNSTELAYLRIGFPTCWCAKSVPDPERRQAEAAYQSTWRSLTGSPSPGQPAGQAGQPAKPAGRARPDTRPDRPRSRPGSSPTPARAGSSAVTRCSSWPAADCPAT